MLTETPEQKYCFRGNHTLRIRLLSGKFSYTPIMEKISPPEEEEKPLSGGDSPMGLVGDRISHKPSPENRAPRGSNGLTKLGKELIEDGIIYLYRFNTGIVDYARSNQLVFWTHTIPTHYADGSPLTTEDHQRILEQWPEITRQIFQEISREQERLNIPSHYLYVVEPQEERWERYGQFAPHIHAILCNTWDKEAFAPGQKGFEAKGSYLLRIEKLDEITERVYSNILGRCPNMAAANRADTLRGMKALFFYLSKFGKIGSYISKGSKLLGELRSCGVTLPSSWYGSDAETKFEVRSSVYLERGHQESIPEFRERLEQINRSREEEERSPLFRPGWVVEVADCPWPVSFICQCSRLSDIPIMLLHFGCVEVLPIQMLEESKELKERVGDIEAMLQACLAG